MRKLLAGLILLGATGTASADVDVGVSIAIGDPNFYGRIDIGDMPHPQIVYPEPMIITPVGVRPAPVYMRIPPGHQKHWDKHCMEYNACGVPVYFVQDNWYSDVYAPAYKAKHGKGNSGGGQGKGKKPKGQGHGPH